ncbi:uncharacterized protein LTR77_010233 [Saxophila tyrrhenica]|uniref:INO80 complex subunit B-like conserved region domain-containing protein n=1 Tax=Saxophila tyrrhenica TaxID=1690608 RepID=A0AAV9NZ24_9PEZI|nr:hypothetical protein LTR77_010233 [Saxophila tyrrhenica]
MPPARRSTRTSSSSNAAPYSRTNRRASPSSSRPSASIARPANGKTSLRLTVKAAPSKLRQATSGSAPIPPNPYADNPSESDATPAPATRTARTTRNPRTVVEPESDEDEDEDAAGENERQDRDEDMEDVDQEILANEDSEDDDEDAEGEDDEEDVDDHPPPPIIKQNHPSGQVKPNVTVTAPQEGPMKSVEDKEMDDDDEELSELDSNEDAEGEEDEEEDDSDEDEDNSRSATPDLSKLTRRQRGVYEEEPESSLMALSNEAQKKKHLTDAEQDMRRQEMARRRKNLSEKRNEEEKMDTINKLLKKPAPKRRTRAEIIAQQHADAMATPGAEDGEEERPDPLYVRWVNTKEGSRIGVPEEWLEAPVGEMFSRPVASLGSGRMVEEVA